MTWDIRADASPKRRPRRLVQRTGATVTCLAICAVTFGTAAVANTEGGSSQSPNTTQPLSPQPPIVSEQLVTATLAPNGLPESSEIITRVVATNVPEQTVMAETSTRDVRYLDKSGRPLVDGDLVGYPVGGPGQTSTATQSRFTKPLPVALHAEYATSGEGAKGVDPLSVTGMAGDMTVRYTVTNTSVATQTITYTDAAGIERTAEQPVFSPFVGTMIATLAPGVALKDAGSAVVSTNTEGRTTLLWNLVLYPPLGNYQQDVSYRVDSGSMRIPTVQMQVVPVMNSQDPAVGFSANLLSQSVKGNTTLVDGLTQLDASTTKLANGAAELSTAQLQAAKATKKAAKGSAGITKGTASLADGLVELSSGLNQLSATSGLPAAAAAAGQLAAAVNQIVAGVGAASDQPIPPPPPMPSSATLVQAARAAQTAAQLISAGSASAAKDANDAITSIDKAIAELCVPVPTTPACADLAVARVKATSAATKAALVAAGATALDKSVLDSITKGLIQVSTALKSLNTAKPGVYEGLEQLQDSLKTAAAASAQLAAGAGQAATGSEQLAGASGQLTEGLQQLSDGSAQLADGSDALASGAEQLQQEGTATVLDGVISSSKDPAMADAYLAAASARAESSAPYPAPDGATARVAFVYELNEPDPKPTTSPALIGIMAIAVIAFAVVAVRRIRQPA